MRKRGNQNERMKRVKNFDGVLEPEKRENMKRFDRKDEIK